MEIAPASPASPSPPRPPGAHQARIVLTPAGATSTELLAKLPTRRRLSASGRLHPNEVYIGRGVPQHRIPTSRWCNPFRLR